MIGDSEFVDESGKLEPCHHVCQGNPPEARAHGGEESGIEPRTRHHTLSFLIVHWQNSVVYTNIEMSSGGIFDHYLI